MLTIEDYQKIEKFKDAVHRQHFLDKEYDAFRRLVCAEFDKIFGYHHVVFGYLNLSKERGTSLSVLIHDVNERFFEKFYISGTLSQGIYKKKDVVRYSELENYQKKVVFRDILTPYGFTDFTLCYLPLNGKYIGYLLFFRDKTNKKFTDRDTEILGRLREYIAVEYYNSIKITQLYNSVRLLESQSNYYPIGVIIMDKMLTVSYSNKLAKKYMEDLGVSSEKFFSIFYNNHLVPHINKDLLRLGGQQIVRYKNYIFSIYVMNIQSAQFFDNIESMEQNGFYKYMGEYVPEAKSFIYFTKDEMSSYSNAGNPYEEFGFTKREEQIAELLRMGKDVGQIAAELSISPNTVKSHIQKLYRKANVSSRTEFLYRMTTSNR